MATSDNVVRAGLTPKLRDVDTLVSMLTYEAGPGSRQLLQPVQLENDSRTLLYDPPIDEFSVLKIGLTETESTEHKAISGPSMCIVTNGEGSISWGESELAFGRGDVIFIGAETQVKWVAKGDTDIFRAFVEAI